jgi:hypothetical protein
MESPMVRSTISSPRKAALSLLPIAVLIAACSGGGTAAVSQPPSQAATVASPATVATARPTPRPTPVSTVEPSPTPKLTAAPPDPEATPVDAAAALKIGAPYKLRANPANKDLSASFELTIGGVHVTETITGREITNAGRLVGEVLVLQIKGVPVTAEFFEPAVQGAARNVGGTITYTTISGVKVALIKATAGTFGMVMLHREILMVIGKKPADTKPLLTAVIKANK